MSDSLYVRHEGITRRKILVGAREVAFDANGVSEPLTQDEFAYLTAIPRFEPADSPGAFEGTGLMPEPAARVGDFFVHHEKWAGRRLNIGQREVNFNPDGISDALTEAEHANLCTIPGVSCAGAVFPQHIEEALPVEGEAPAFDLAGFGDEVQQEVAWLEQEVPVSPELPTDELSILTTSFKSMDLEKRIERVGRDDLTRAQLDALFDVEAKWPKARRVLEAIQQAMVRIPNKTADQINVALLKASAEG